MKKENEQLMQIYEKNCECFKVNEEVFLFFRKNLWKISVFLKDSFNLEKYLNTLDKSDRKKYDILNYINYMMSNCENSNQQLEVFINIIFKSKIFKTSTFTIYL